MSHSGAESKNRDQVFENAHKHISVRVNTPLPFGERLGEGKKQRAFRPSANPSLQGRGTFETQPSLHPLNLADPVILSI